MSNKASKRKAKQMGGLSELQHAMTHKATQKKNTHTYDKLPSKGGKAKQPNQPSKHASVHVVTHRERESNKKRKKRKIAVTQGRQRLASTKAPTPVPLQWPIEWGATKSNSKQKRNTTQTHKHNITSCAWPGTEAEEQEEKNTRD